MKISPLIDATDALLSLDDNNTRFVDATWYLPNVPENGREVYKSKHLPGAVYFDIDEVADPSSSLPHMYPTVERFEQCVENLGISSDNRLIIYDRTNYLASARVWWMFRSFGHDDVQVLNGGLKEWEKHGGTMEAGEPQTELGNFTAQAPKQDIIEWKELSENLCIDAFNLLDARSPSRFSGAEPEPRPGLRGGNIPGSLNLHYADVIGGDGKIIGTEEISSKLEHLNLAPSIPIVTTCGSGVTAAILLLAIFQVRQDSLRLYDGSWTEWALNPNSPQLD